MKYIKRILVICFLGAWSLFADASDFYASGVLDSSRSYHTGKTQQLPTFEFEVWVHDCQWLIQVKEKGAKTPAALRTKSFDGKNVYTLGTYGGTEVTPPKWGGGIESEGSIPFEGPFPTIPIIWLALASACTLDKDSTRMLPPYAIDLVRSPLDIVVSRRHGKGGLPEKIDFLDDGYDRRSGPPQKRLAPFDKGFTNAIFSAWSFTNGLGIDFPLQFNLKTFIPSGPPGGEKRLISEYFFEGRILSTTSNLKPPPFIPEIPSGSNGRIGDFRFGPPTALMPKAFMYSTNRWLSVEEVRTLPGFGEYASFQNLPEVQTYVAAAAVKGAPPSPGRRWIVILALLCVAALPLILLYRRKRAPFPPKPTNVN